MDCVPSTLQTHEAPQCTAQCRELMGGVAEVPMAVLQLRHQRRSKWELGSAVQRPGVGRSVGSFGV